MFLKNTFFILILFGINNQVFCVTNSPTSPLTFGPTYDTKFDNIDIDVILKQERLLVNYIKCLEKLGSCSSDAKLLRDILPDAISTNCERCSAIQKYDSEKITHFLIDRRPADWERLEKIYDPTGSYRKKYIDEKSKDHAKSPKESL